MTQQFRKLNIDLPRQPLSDQKAWTIAGWLLAAILIAIIAISYIGYVNGHEGDQAQGNFGTSTEYNFIDPVGSERII